MDWTSSWRELFDEAFLGSTDGTWFVESKEAFLPIVDALSAGQASWSPAPSVSSVAGHVRHAAYYMRLTIESARSGAPAPADWAGSWAVQAVDDQQWAELKEALKSAYQELRGLSEGWEPRSQDEATSCLANLAHVAFHLGSVRQLAVLAGWRPD